MSYSSFSQTVIDTTRIVLTNRVAKLVAQDVVKGDQLELELNVTQNLLEEVTNKLDIQTELTSNLEKRLDNYVNIVDGLEGRYEVQEELTEEFKKALKKQKRRTFLYQVGTVVGAAATLILIAN
jgi:hypothetical protein